MSDFDTSRHHQATNGAGGNAGDSTPADASVTGIGNGNAGATNGIGNGIGPIGPANGFGAAPDIFSDLSALRMDQSFADSVGVKKLLLTVPIRKPHAQEFVRTHPEFRLPGAPVIELKDDRETFLLKPNVAEMLPSTDFKLRDLFLTISRQGVLFVWAVPVPTADGRGRSNAWHTTGRDAAVLATTQWVRISANMALGAYDVSVATVKLPEPEWPTDKSFSDILRIAFRDRVIETVDHPVIQRLLHGA
jgi:hypothetical protein